MKLKIACLLLMFLLCFCSQNLYAQTLTITGKVNNKATGVALSGATITVKGTKKSTVTDDKGNYTISAEKGQTLVVNYVGLTSAEQVIKTAGELNFSLEQSTENTLSDVVVVNVGYGTQKKSVVTGSISSVKAKDIENVPNGRVEQVLQGRVSGVTIAQNSGQPGAPSTVRIRGVTTFGGGNNPLWVVDGVVVDAGATAYLNQSDIESVEVLKDAASAAIYGTRAATGVILVTTKKGKAGKMTVSYNGFYGSSEPAKVLDLLNATQYATLMNERSTAGGGSVLYPNLSGLGTGTDWQKAIFNNNAKRSTHEISLSGGSEKSNYYFSFASSDQQGIVATDISNYNKKSIRINSNHKLSEVFTFGQTLGYAHQQAVGLGNTNSEFGGPLSSSINLDPITPIVITDPILAGADPYKNNPVIRDANGNPYGISSIVGQEMTNPLAYIQTRLGGYNWSDDIIGNAFLEVTINKDIKIKSTIAGKLAFWGGQDFTPVYYLNATNSTLQNSFGKYINNTSNWNIENTITYSKKIKDHNFSVLLGQGAYKENNGGGSSVTLFNLPISSYKDASFNFDIPQANRTSGSYGFTEHKNASLFTRVNYNFQEKYLFTGIIRRDGSTRFPWDFKNGTFPSFSLGWVVNKENFWKSNVINSLKIRGGHGVTGNDAIRDFGYLSTVAGGFNYTLGNGGAITTGYAPTSLDNPDLKWEQTSQTSVGFDAQILKNINLTVEYYKKTTTGILRPLTIPGYVGVSTPPVGNVASMQNSGIEIELGYRKKIGQVNMSVNGNFSYLKNEVTYVAADADFIVGDASFQSMGVVTRTKVGQSYNSFYGYQTAGIFQTVADVNAYTNKSGTLLQPNARPGDFRWVDINGDGAITTADKTFLGTNLPKYTYGITINLDYKGFDFMMFAQGAAGNKIFQGLRRLDIATANYQTKAMGRWTAAGTSNDYPRLTSNDVNGNFTNMSDFYLEKGDYLRLKVVTLGYTFPGKIIKKISATRLRVYVTAENLLTLTNYTGYDPEVGGGVFGIDKGMYPQARSFIGGVQLQF